MSILQITECGKSHKLLWVLLEIIVLFGQFNFKFFGRMIYFCVPNSGFVFMPEFMR